MKKANLKNQPVTLDQVSNLLDKQTKVLQNQIVSTNTRIDNLRDEFTISIRDVNLNFNVRLGGVEKRLDDRLIILETKMDAVMEEASTRREVRNLVRELKGQGLKLNPAKIFIH